MRNLLNFLIKNFSWLVFIFYVVISCALLFQFNSYQHHVYLTSANKVSAWIYGGVSNITSYFHLRDINEDLQSRNSLLEMEVVNLKNAVRSYQTEVAAKINPADSANIMNHYQYIGAYVINNSITMPYNYITINKGSLDGVKPEMGIVDQNGVVGIVNVVGEHSARAISLLNPNFRLSCKVKGSDCFGSLVWNGKSPNTASLEEMPRHVKFVKGDTIITSGYSSVFPEGLIVGTIEGALKSSNDNFYTLKIHLSTDFTQLSTVRVIKNNQVTELKKLEEEDQDE